MLCAQLLTLQRSIENPEIPLTDPRAWTSLGGQVADNGLAMTADRLLEYSPIWSGITQIAGDVAQTPLYVYKRVEGGKERYKRHPAYKLLRRQSNLEMAAHTWLQVMVTNALIYGRAYSEIVRDNGGRPVALVPIASERVRVARSPSGRLTYVVLDGPGGQIERRPEDMFAILGLTLDGIGGLSLIQYARNSVGRGLAAEKYSNKFFSNNARPGGFLVHPARLDDEAINNLRQNFASDHQGLDNAHRFGILEEGMQWVQMGVPPEAAQLISSLEFGVRDAARVLGIPAHRLGDDSRSSYNSLEQENLAYQQSSLGRWYHRIQEEAYVKLTTEDEQKRDTVTVEFERNKILQADAKTRSEVYSKGILDGWLNRDEVRGMENLNAIPDGAGQEFFKPMNMADAGEDEPDDEPVEDTAQTDDQRSTHEALLRATMARAAKRLEHYVTRAAKDAAKFCEEIDNFDRHVPVIEDYLEEVVPACASVGLEYGPPGELAKRYVDMWARTMQGAASRFSEDDLPREVATLASALENCEVVQPAGTTAA